MAPSGHRFKCVGVGCRYRTQVIYRLLEHEAHCDDAGAVWAAEGEMDDPGEPR